MIEKTKQERSFKAFWLTMVFFAMLALFYIFNHDEKSKILKTDFSSKIFIGMLGLVILISIWGLRNKNMHINISTHRAFVAFLIAYLAHLDMVFGVFGLVWLFTYHSSEKDYKNYMGIY
jgi:hypothetical protein